jgi:hypothetical protein
MYAMVGTRPDLAYAITALSQCCSNPGKVHWAMLKRVLRYIQHNLDYGLTYSKTDMKNCDIASFFKQGNIHGYCDSDWGGSIDDRKSVTGYSFMIGNAAVSWKSKKQSTVALSTVESEYMALSECMKEALWIRQFLAELLQELVNNVVTIYSDNQGSIALSKNPEYHSRTKHIDMRHHLQVMLQFLIVQQKIWWQISLQNHYPSQSTTIVLNY